jgi:multiple sugar transport system substrate-binding protein
MSNFTRRTLVKGGTAAMAAGALTGPALLEWAKAWAQSAPWKPEKDAKLSMLRWKYFVQSEDDAFVKLIEAFTKATGVKVDIARESYEDVQPKASVAANTGTGPDLFWGLYSLPHLFRRNASTSQTSPTISARNTEAGCRAQSPMARAATSGSRSRSAIPAI